MKPLCTYNWRCTLKKLSLIFTQIQKNTSTNTLISTWYQVKVTPSALRNASAAHQKSDVLLLRILQLGKYYFNSSQMEISRAGQGPEALKEWKGWMDHSWKGSKVTHKVTVTCNISTTSGGQRRGGKNFHLNPSSQTFCWTIIPCPILISSCLRRTHMLSNSLCSTWTQRFCLCLWTDQTNKLLLRQQNIPETKYISQGAASSANVILHTELLTLLAVSTSVGLFKSISKAICPFTFEGILFSMNP